MIGRVYMWSGAFWQIRVRGEPFDRGPRRNVLLVRVAPMRPLDWLLSDAGVIRCLDGRWWSPRPAEWTIRPFRGLRRVRPADLQASS